MAKQTSNMNMAIISINAASTLIKTSYTNWQSLKHISSLEKLSISELAKEIHQAKNQNVHITEAIGIFCAAYNYAYWDNKLEPHSC